MATLLASLTTVLLYAFGVAPQEGVQSVGVALPPPGTVEELVLASPIHAIAAVIESTGATVSRLPPEKPQEAAAWYLAHASEGDPTAQYEIAIRYAEGRGVARDYARAAAWFREAAINGVAAAQYDLGILYEKGLGLPPDPIEALIWVQSAADQNESIAQFKLGTFYLKGEAMPRKPAEAARWLRRAADQGVAEAEATLAMLYEQGDGVALSARDAYGWYSLAAAAGLPEAQQAKTRLAERLAPAALGDAETFATTLAARIVPNEDLAQRQGSDGLLLTPAVSGRAVALSRGMVSEIQRLLRTASYEVGPVDGIVGEQTAQAIRRYQQDAGLPVDGTPGLTLLNRLRATAAGRPPAVSP